MKRRTLLAAVLAVLMFATGCGSGDDATPETETRVASDTGGDAVAPVVVAEPMPPDGPGEAAAVAALPGALKQAEELQASAGAEWPDLGSAEPALTAYIIAVEMNGQIALFEVRADGIVHSLYAYQRSFDAATMVWSPTENSPSKGVAPQSGAEQAAAAAVEAAMRDSFPDSTMSTTVYGYRFVYVKGGAAALTLEVSADGSVISVN